MDPRLYKAAATLGRVEEHAHLIKEIKKENHNLLLGVTPTLENTVFHLAARFGHMDFIKEVYDEQCESLLAMTNSKGDTALHIAARAGHHSIVKFLVEKSLSVSTSLDAEQGGNQTINILRIQNEGKNTVLHEALRYRHEEVVVELTEWDDELWSIVNKVGESPLYLAAKGGLTEIVRQVLQFYHSYPHGGPEDLTALHAAAIWNKHDIVKLLAEKKSELIKEKDLYGRTALHYAASYHKYGQKCDVVKLLLEIDSSVAYIQDNDGRSPLHFAAGKGDNGVTEEIIRCYPDAVDLVDKRGQNAIHYCISECHLKVRPYTDNYINVLHCLMSKGWHGELLNQQDNDGNTPLHLAVISGISDLVKCMLSNKERLDTDTMNKYNLTPRDLTIHSKLASKEEIAVYWDLYRVDAKFGIAEPLNGKEWDLVNATKDSMFINSLKELRKNQMIVATLIATVTFAAAFQVPGGYKTDNGTSVLADDSTFKRFLDADATAFRLSMSALVLSFGFTLLRNWPSSKGGGAVVALGGAQWCTAQGMGGAGKLLGASRRDWRSLERLGRRQRFGYCTGLQIWARLGYGELGFAGELKSFYQ
ncbi:hypothetical protein HHK36_022295 [Tetracentron sinense]|uniref:PGG domain-containing protein n=1 Tax=Tetracentron sinense TaxID=13715 RepID=A0A834YPK5_TETSI|nr:hypothetical protein HHK36_022295 [Tetracentron sinense]